MITLYQLPPAHGMPVSTSPYCAKLDAYFRLTDRPFTHAKADLMKSPTKTVPYIQRDDGPLQGDSQAIIPALEAEGPALDGDLSDEQRAAAAHLAARAEEVLYFVVLFSRFVDPEGWKLQHAVVKGLVPWVVAPLAVPFIRRSQVKRCTAAGFTEVEPTYAAGNEVLDELAEALDDGRPFFLGDAPHVVDCAVWGELVHAATPPFDNTLTRHFHADDRLTAYLRRMNERLGLDPGLGGV